MILLKAQDIANEIIGQAIDINTSLIMQDDQVSFDTMAIRPDLAESTISKHAREMVHSIIENALTLSMGPVVKDPGLAECMPDTQDILGPIEGEGDLSPIQSQILTKARSMVYNAITKATGLSMERRKSINAAMDSDCRLDLMECELMNYEAQAIVSRVVKKAIELSLGRIQTLYSEAGLGDEEVRAYIIIHNILFSLEVHRP